jgi:hypothetical protein
VSAKWLCYGLLVSHDHADVATYGTSADPPHAVDLLQFLHSVSQYYLGVDAWPWHMASWRIDRGRKRLMQETWLKSNRRAILFGCIPPLLLAAIGAWLGFLPNVSSGWRWLGIVMIIVSLCFIGTMVMQLRRPRIAYRDQSVLFYLRSGPPIAAPVEIVEAFFAGQGPAHLPGLARQPQAVNLIARLSQRHTEWARRDVKPALGNWCEGYVTIRGAWCEPLDGELIRKLNRRLKEVKDRIVEPS